MDSSGAGGTVARRTTPQHQDHSISHPGIAALGLQEAVGSLLKPRSPLHPDHHATRAHHHTAALGAHHAATAHPVGSHTAVVQGGHHAATAHPGVSHTAAAPGGHHEATGRPGVSHAAAAAASGGHHAATAHPGLSHTAAGASVDTSSASSSEAAPAGTASTATASHELALPYSSYVQAVEEALHYAFRTTDEELMGTETGEDIGATAVVAVLGKEHIWIAHCGESADQHLHEGWNSSRLEYCLGIALKVSD